MADSTVAIRTAEPDDAAAIMAIYRDAVLHGTATFELEPPDTDEIGRRMARLAGGGFPWLVAEEAGGSRVVGYAYAGPYRDRPAYRWTVEDSVYLAPDCTGRGIGRQLLSELIERAALAGYRQMIAVIGDAANAGSIALHRACGFRAAGTLEAVGRKHGRWLATVVMQRELGLGSQCPPDDGGIA